MAEYDVALEIDPNSSVAYAGRAQALLFSGRASEAFSPLQAALHVSPKDPFTFVWHFNLCHVHLHLHEYSEAIEECRRSINSNNSFSEPYIDLIAAYAATEQLDQAQRALADLSKLQPNFTVERYRERVYGFSSNPQFRRELDDILDGLKKGGARER